MENEFEKTLSTGEVARLCHATTASVNNWIKNNKIKAYNTPGGQYRILIKDLLTFIKDNNMPIPGELKKYFGKKVLIIDDDPNTVEMLKDVVEMTRDDCEILIANDGYAGLIKAGEFAPDIIFLDIQLPKIDGFEVCEKIKSNASNKHTKIFILSAFVQNKEYQHKFNSCKADEVLGKPCEIKKLQSLLEKQYLINIQSL